MLLMERDEVKEMINKKKTGSETLAAYEEHLNQVTSFYKYLNMGFCNHVSYYLSWLVIINKLFYIISQKFRSELKKNREKVLGASEGSSKTKRKEVYVHVF